MRTCFQRLAGTAALLAALAVSPLAVAQEAEAPGKGASTANVLIIVRIGKLEAAQRVPVKEYHLLVADGTPGSKLLSGQRVPFPGPAGSDGAALVYQNIGFSVQAMAWIADSKTIKLVAEMEDSRVQEGKGGAPIVETRQLSVNAMLTDGVPVELTRVEGTIDPSGFVEVEARIVR